MPLNDTHLVLLSAASQRDDGLLPRPGKLAGIALHKLRGFLIKQGLVEEVGVRSDQPHWTKADADKPLGLRITPAGLAAIAVEHPGLGVTDQTADCCSNVLSVPESADAGERARSNPAGRVATKAPPRTGTKIARLTALVMADGGTTIDALVSALDWQPHTVRAALTRLRQSGLAIITAKDDQGRTVYRSVSNPSPSEAQPQPQAEVA